MFELGDGEGRLQLLIGWKYNADASEYGEAQKTLFDKLERKEKKTKKTTLISRRLIFFVLG